MQFSKTILVAVMAISSVVAVPNYPKSSSSAKKTTAKTTSVAKTTSSAAGGTTTSSAASGGSTTSSAAGGSTTTAPSQSCGSDQTQLCCETVDTFLGLTCVLSSILGTSCSAETICCINEGDGNQTCTDSTGTAITVPITVGVSLPISIPITLPITL